MTVTPIDDSTNGTFALGDRTVRRNGFGAMRITGDGIWGPPPDRDEALAVLRRAVDLGINLIDTADSYGPNVSEELIAEALHPYPDDLVIATKAGLLRTGPNQWPADGRPEHIREACEGSLRRLRVERIDVYQFHRPDPQVPFEDSVGTFAELQKEGKIAQVGLSNVTVDQLRAAQEIVPIVSVQNRYNLVERDDQDVLEACEADSIAFIPWFPLKSAELAKGNGPVAQIAKAHDATPAQVALAWLLASSPVMLPIPGTGKVSHLEENVAAAHVQLTGDEVEQLADAA
jgi:pyridoxine 4-dehydrogenase